MNFDNYSFEDNMKEKLNNIFSYQRMPQAVIIDGGNSEKRMELAKFISAFAVCNSKNAPCLSCENCKKAESKNHPDIEYVLPQYPKNSHNKKFFTADVMRDVVASASIKPNEANRKVYVFKDCSVNLPEISQNILLKTLEEPPQDILFILEVNNALELLPTINSRCVNLSFPMESSINDEEKVIAEDISRGILDLYEYSLLKTLGNVKKKDQISRILLYFKDILRDVLVFQNGGTQITSSQNIPALSKKLRQAQILALMDLCDQAQVKINFNTNMNLLTTWLSGELRRLSWQR